MAILRFPKRSHLPLCVKYTTENGAAHLSPPVRGGWKEADKLCQQLLAAGMRTAVIVDRTTLEPVERPHKSYPEYPVWKNLKIRCCNPKYSNGFGMCKRWEDSFQDFLADMGPLPAGYCLRRHDAKEDFLPGNCYWGKSKPPRRDAYRNDLLTHNGETHTIAEWAARVGLLPRTIKTRLTKGDSVARAIRPPLKETSDEYCKGLKAKGYYVWQGMLARCHNSKIQCYPYYGGSGIKVCPRWFKFENFIADMGPRPSLKHSLERKDYLKDYCPENCEWILRADQPLNTRRNVRLTYQGKTQTVSQWAKELGMGSSTIHARLRLYGWTVERALSTPVHHVS